MTAGGSTISVLVGVLLFRLAATGSYTRYVRGGMGAWLLVAGVLLVMLGTVTLVRALAGQRHDEDCDDDHAGGIGVGWLLLVPIMTLLLVAPPTLGSYGLERASWVDVRAGAPVFSPIPMVDGPIDMSLLEFGQRAYDHHGESFNGATVRLTGFVAGREPDGFRVARYQIACCAADAAPVVVRVVGPGHFRPDQWVTVTGTFVDDSSDLSKLAATNVTEISAPNDPYE